MADKTTAEEKTEVEKQAEQNAALKAEIKQLEEERLAEEALQVDESKFSQLRNEEAKLQTELEYQRRLKAARSGAIAAPTTNTATPQVVVPTQGSANKEDNSSDEKAGSAKTETGKGK